VVTGKQRLQANARAFGASKHKRRYLVEWASRVLREASPTSLVGLLIRPAWAIVGGGETTVEAVFGIVDVLAAAGIGFWIVGGWGVDLLVGRQGRRHHDVDVLLADFAADEARAVAALEGLGYRTVATGDDESLLRPRNTLRDGEGHQVELLGLDRAGLDAALGDDDGAVPVETRRPGLFAVGTIADRVVPCISAEFQRLLRETFRPRGIDVHDARRLEALTTAGSG
jgi:lincosamide nucleotidyltransferase A/C/D/E